MNIANDPYLQEKIDCLKPSFLQWVENNKKINEIIEKQNEKD